MGDKEVDPDDAFLKRFADRKPPVKKDGGYYEYGLAASGNTYYLKKEDGKWKVYDDKQHWIA